MKSTSPKVTLLVILVCSCLITNLEFNRYVGGWKPTPESCAKYSLLNADVKNALRASRSVIVYTGQESIPILEVPEFSARVRPALKRLAQRDGTYPTTAFFVSDLMENKPVLVYWPEQNRIILFEPHTGPDYNDLLFSRRDWDLKEDVGPLEVAQTSTYLLTEEMAEEMKERCLRGTPFTLER